MFRSSSLFRKSSVAPGQGVSSDIATCREVVVVGNSVQCLAIASLANVSRVWLQPTAGAATVDQVSEVEIRNRSARVCAHRGPIPVAMAEADDDRSVSDAEGLFICAPADDYGSIVDRLSGLLTDGQIIALVDAPLGGALQFRQILRDRGCDRQVTVIEIGRLYDTATVESSVVLISGVRLRVSLCGTERNQTRRGLALAQCFGKEIVPSSNIIERGLTDVERIMRPVALVSTLVGGGSEYVRPEFDNPFLGRLIEAVEHEVQGIARSYGCIAPHFVRSINDLCTTEAESTLGKHQPKSLEEVLKTAGNSLLLMQDRSVETAISLIRNDVKEVLTLLSDLGARSRSKTSTIDSIIDLAGAVTGENLRARGRNLDQLGLVGFDTREIIDLVNA